VKENPDLGKLILRLVLGFCMLLHGISKITGGIDGIVASVQGHGLPGFVAYGAYIGEVIGPLMVLAGFHARLGAVLIAVNMFVALALVHMGDIFRIGEHGEWAIELQAMFLFGAIAIALLGPGRYSVSNK